MHSELSCFKSTLYGASMVPMDWTAVRTEALDQFKKKQSATFKKLLQLIHLMRKKSIKLFL